MTEKLNDVMWIELELNP